MSAAAEMEDLDQLSDHDFRMLVRDFIEKYYPPELRNSPRRLHFKDTKGWYRTLARKGWLCPNWPKQFGGMGISVLSTPRGVMAGHQAKKQNLGGELLLTVY